MANQLSAVMRASDTLSRHGGDAFIALLNEISSLEDVEKVTDKMEQVLAEPYYMNEHKICLSASISVAIYPQHGLDTKTFINYADQTMYHVKNWGQWLFVNRLYQYLTNTKSIKLVPTQKLIGIGIRYVR